MIGFSKIRHAKIVLAVVASVAAVALSFAVGSPLAGCISCNWLSPDQTRGLFKASQHWTDSIANNGVVPLSDPLKDEAFMAVLGDITDIMDAKTCDARLINSLVTMLARLEEGENPALKGQAPYVKLGLTGMLEQHHIRLLDICHKSAKEMVQQFKVDTNALSTRRIFLAYAADLKGRLARVQTANRTPGSGWFTGGMSFFQDSDPSDNEALPVAERDIALMNRARNILKFNYLYEKIRDQSGAFFGATPGSPSCQSALANNLQAKHNDVGSGLAHVLEPLLALNNYNPENFVTIPAEAKEGRQIFAALEASAQELAKDRELSDLVALYKLMRQTFSLAKNMCQP